MPDPYDGRYPLFQQGRKAIFKPHPEIDRVVRDWGIFSKPVHSPYHFVISGMHNATTVRYVQGLVARKTLGHHDRWSDVVLLGRRHHAPRRRDPHVLHVA